VAPANAILAQGTYDAYALDSVSNAMVYRGPFTYEIRQEALGVQRGTLDPSQSVIVASLHPPTGDNQQAVSGILLGIAILFVVIGIFWKPLRKRLNRQ
jgi:hypothetical protein